MTYLEKQKINFELGEKINKVAIRKALKKGLVIPIVHEQTWTVERLRPLTVIVEQNNRRWKLRVSIEDILKNMKLR